MPDQPRALMLFAAGFGTRMAPLTDDRPKPLIEVAGKPLLDHALALAEDISLPRVVVNAHYRADQIERHLSDRTVTVLVENPEILDTGGGLRAALPHLGHDPVFTLNSDAVWTGPNPLQTLLNAWDPDRMDGLLLLVPVNRATGHESTGDFRLDPDGRIERGSGYVYSGLQILKTERLKDIPERVFSLNRLWDLLNADGRLHGAVHPGGWCDVGRPSGIALAETLLAGADNRQPGGSSA